MHGGGGGGGGGREHCNTKQKDHLNATADIFCLTRSFGFRVTRTICKPTDLNEL